MNVAILGTEQASTIVAEIIEGEYNLWLEKNLAEPLKVVAYATGGGVLILIQSAARQF